MMKLNQRKASWKEIMINLIREKSNLIQTNHINSIDRIQPIKVSTMTFFNLLDLVMDIASYKAKTILLNTRFAEIYNTLQSKIELPYPILLIKNAIPSGYFKYIKKAYPLKETAI